MKEMKRISPLMLSATALVLALTACTSPASQKQPDHEAPVKVSAYAPIRLSGGDLQLSGIVSARQTAMVSTRLMGVVDRVLVKQGDRVAKGQLLVRISSDDLRAKQAQAQAQIAEAEAAVRNARRDHERFQTLREQNSVSDKELENVALQSTSLQARLQMARQGLKEVEALLAYAHIRAPFSGVVVQRLIDEGSTSAPGMPLLALEQTGELNVTATLPEAYTPHVAVGTPVEVTIKSLGRTLPGKVAELSPSASLTGGQYNLKVSLPEDGRQGLLPGMVAGVRLAGALPQGGDAALRVEAASVVRREQLTGLYVLGGDDRAILRWVRLGQEAGGQVEVLSGLRPTDRVIRPGRERLYNGKKVTLQN